MSFSFTKRYASVTSVSALLFAAACGAQGESPVSAGQPISVQDLGQELDGASKRIEVKLATGLDAREVELYPDSELADEEHIESTLVDILDDGSLALDLGGLVVAVHAGARFRTETDSDVAADVWHDDVEARLASGTPVFVRVSRTAPPTPQATSDSSFVAEEVRIEEADEVSIEMTVSGDSLEASSTDSGTLTLLGLPIAITAATEIHLSSDDDATGSDDPPGDDNGTGDDDPPGDDHGAGNDDGPNHE